MRCDYTIGFANDTELLLVAGHWRSARCSDRKRSFVPRFNQPEWSIALINADWQSATRSDNGALALARRVTSKIRLRIAVGAEAVQRSSSSFRRGDLAATLTLW